MAAPIPLNAPIPLPLPVFKSNEYYTDSQWQTLFALLDAIIPSIVVDTEVTDKNNQLSITEAQCREAYERTKRNLKHAPSYDKFKEYLRVRPVDNPNFVEETKRVIGNISKGNKKELGVVLSVLNTRLGSLVATGSLLPLQEQSLEVKETILQSWNQARLNFWPMLGESFFKMAKSTFLQTDPLFHEISGFKHHTEDYKPGSGFEYEFMQFPAGSETERVTADVVIVGSGCGGAVCAKVLTEAGHDVVVVDKGYYFPPSQLPMTPQSASEYLYEGKGGMQSVDRSVGMLAGSCWGGGGTVNWSASLQLQGFVRQEWADRGLGFFTSQEFQDGMDRICEFMGVTDTGRPNHGNKVILDGARKLGWHAKACPQNTGGAEHYCGSCHAGCGSAEKRGPSVSWLPAAAQAGARFIEGFNVSKVLFDESTGSGKAVGIVGEWTSRDEDGRVNMSDSEGVFRRTVEVRAKRVIVAGGTLNSPLLLTRSGLKNPHIGKNLYLHPAAGIHATFDEDIKGWEGGILTSVCTSFENLDGKGHGVKLEASVMAPHILLYEHPWESALQWKLDALRYRQMANYISLVRDRDTGRVYADPDDGRPVVAYTPSAFDRAHLLTGLVAIAKLCYIQGATEIWSRIPGVPSFVRRRPVVSSVGVGVSVGVNEEGKGIAGPGEGVGEGHADTDDDDIAQGINDPDFVAWLRLLEKTGLGSPRATFGCAHQMGTCRMSARPGDGVVDPRGRVWEADGLYVADASVFPSASGVNPMITNMAIADYIARGVSRGLRRVELKL
ncbi:Uu.00g002850.m01.CDS01 [Anthostomella pinea]|uniref:Long-chain-alcohol oxidase n=1 Tax=Anthostomella pinea TaxID=933095 RepID=A0AAI8VJM0_9PEZI|nr:Uu.00g002850.m01.CDS01 [Anthostomella pinea]